MEEFPGWDSGMCDFINVNFVHRWARLVVPYLAAKWNHPQGLTYSERAPSQRSVDWEGEREVQEPEFFFFFKASNVILMIIQSWEFLVKSISFFVNPVRHFIHCSGMVFKNIIQGYLPNTPFSSLSTYFQNFL